MRIRIPFQFQFPLAALAVLCSVTAAADSLVAATKPITRVDFAGKRLPNGAVSRLQGFQPILSRNRSLRFSPDGKLIIAGRSRYGHVLWDTVTGREIRSVPKDALTFFTPTGRPIAALASNDKKWVRLIDMRSGRKLHSFHVRDFNAVAMSATTVSPNGAVLLLYMKDAKSITSVVPLITDSGRMTTPISLGRVLGSHTLIFDFSGRKLCAVTTGKPSIRVWDTKSGRMIHDIAMPATNVYKLRTAKISADGTKLFVYTRGNSLQRGNVRGFQVYDLNKGSLVTTIAAPATATGVPEIECSSNGWYVSTRYDVYTKMRKSAVMVQVWDIQKQRSLKTISLESISTAIQLSPDGTFLSVTDSRKYLWNIHKDADVFSKMDSNRDTRIDAVRLPQSDDGRLFCYQTASSDYKTRKVHVWDISVGANLSAFSCSGRVLPGGFSPRGRFLVTYSDSDGAYVWDLCQGARQGLQRSPNIRSTLEGFGVALFQNCT